MPCGQGLRGAFIFFIASKSGADIRVRVVVIRVRVREPKARKTDAACRPAHHPIVLKPTAYPDMLKSGRNVYRRLSATDTKPGADMRVRAVAIRARAREPKARRVLI